jgi:hypothetical protein
MPIRVKQDGATLPHSLGTVTINNRDVEETESHVHMAGDIIPDGVLSSHFVGLLEAGDLRVASLVEQVEEEAVQAAAGVSAAAASAPGGEFDPSNHNVEAVLDHLRESSPEEVERVKDAERKGEKRKGVLAYEPPEPEGGQ